MLIKKKAKSLNNIDCKWLPLIFFTEVVEKFKKTVNKGTNASENENENENEGRITSSYLYIISLKASQILIYGRRRYTSQKTFLLRKYCS